MQCSGPNWFYIIVMTVVEFHCEEVKFNRFLDPNEHPQISFLYL